jgi:hypothetical protein
MSLFAAGCNALSAHAAIKAPQIVHLSTYKESAIEKNTSFEKTFKFEEA